MHESKFKKSDQGSSWWQTPSIIIGLIGIVSSIIQLNDSSSENKQDSFINVDTLRKTDFMGEWPLTIDSVLIMCIGNMVIVREIKIPETGTYRIWAVNEAALLAKESNNSWLDIRDILIDGKPVKLIKEEGRKLCGQEWIE